MQDSILFIGKKVYNFYSNNGLIGMCYTSVINSSVINIRGGQNFPRLPQSRLEDQDPRKRRARAVVKDILENEEISEDAKKSFRQVLNEGFVDTHEGESAQRKLEALRKSIIAKCKHPIYNKIKGKIPYLLLAPSTFGELSRLAAYRIAGLSSAPMTIGAWIGFSMPCAVTFSMLEMYAPDKFKFPCKCMKWTGGLVFYGVCYSIDFLTEGFEQKHFGAEMPIDAPQLMGTLPTMQDVEDIKAWSDSFLEKN